MSKWKEEFKEAQSKRIFNLYEVAIYKDDKLDEQEKEIEQLKKQIEKMKCCGNCESYIYFFSSGTYRCKKDIELIDTNCCPEWEIEEDR